MKLEKLIQQLQKLNDEYKAIHGIDPHIWSLDEDGIMLCSKIKKSLGKRLAKKPYLTRKRPRIDFGMVE